MSSDDQDFTSELPDVAKPNWSPDTRRQPKALELVGAVNDQGELTIMPAMGSTMTEWITSDYFVEVGPDV